MTNKHVTIEWLLELIRSGDTSPFYNTKQWGQLAERKRKAERNECERCRAKGKHSQAKAVHHKKYLRLHPELALDYDNLELLCDDCHYDEHHRKEQLNEERW
jgi:5-methylcytosine-specific restriction endonuclease McrA